MSARGFLSVFVFGALSVVAHSASFRPNIVFILADDLVSWNEFVYLEVLITKYI